MYNQFFFWRKHQSAFPTALGLYFWCYLELLYVQLYNHWNPLPSFNFKRIKNKWLGVFFPTGYYHIKYAGLKIREIIKKSIVKKWYLSCVLKIEKDLGGFYKSKISANFVISSFLNSSYKFWLLVEILFFIRK